MAKTVKKDEKTFRGPCGVKMTKTEWTKWREKVENRAEKAERLAAEKSE